MDFALDFIGLRDILFAEYEAFVTFEMFDVFAMARNQIVKADYLVPGFDESVTEM
jgi:hypothetical protein